MNEINPQVKSLSLYVLSEIVEWETFSPQVYRIHIVNNGLFKCFIHSSFSSVIVDHSGHELKWHSQSDLQVTLR